MGGGGQVHPKCKNSMAMSGVGLNWLEACIKVTGCR